MTAKRNVTLRLDPETVRKAKILAARQGTSVSRLLARYLEQAAGQDDAYQSAHRHASQLLDPGLHLGGRARATRDQLHER
jgi:hypothetical protein